MKDDHSFERLLRSARPAQGGIGPCLDAETLAAWVDGGLTSKQIEQTELHVSSCARCQAAVAATMTSAPLVSSSEQERPARSWGLGWLVPLAAGVAAAGLWFMVPSRSQLAPAPESSQVAVDRVAQAPIEQPSPPPPARDQQVAQSAPGNLADAKAQNDERREAATLAAKAEALTRQRADEMATTRARQEAEAKDAAKSAAERSAPPQEPSAGAFAPAVTAPAPAALDPAPPAPAAPASAPVTVGGNAAAAPRASMSATASNRTATIQAVIEVVSPNPSIRWRVSPGGSVERSTDAGATWTPQSSGVSVDLLAGASPSPDVCWLVGRAGTVLRTIDGGRQWQRVTQVSGVDLQAVTATDASTAEVTASDGRRFRTVDAGITWR